MGTCVGWNHVAHGMRATWQQGEGNKVGGSPVDAGGGWWSNGCRTR